MTSRRGWAVLAVALALGGPALGAVETTVEGTTQAGRDRYLANQLSISVAPLKELAFDLVGGRSRSASLIADSSFGGGIWAEAMPRLSLTLHLDRLNGEKGYTEDLRTGDFLLDNAKAQQTNTIAAGATVRVWGGDRKEEDDQDADGEADNILQAVRISVGGSRGTLHVPVTTIGPLGRKRDADYTQRQGSASAGLTAVVTETEVGFTYRRNHFGDLTAPAGVTALNRPRLTAIAEMIRTSAGQVLAEPVAYQSVVTVSETLPHSLAFYGSFEYAVLLYSRGVARTSTIELTWDVVKWLGLKAGGQWVHERKATTPYMIAGVNLYF